MPDEDEDDATTVEDACALELTCTALLALDVPALLDPMLCPLDTSAEDDPAPELEDELLLLSPSGLGPHASTPANNTAPHPNLRIIMVMVLVTSLLSGDPCVGCLAGGVQTRVQDRRRRPTARATEWFVRLRGDPSRQL